MKIEDIEVGESYRIKSTKGCGEFNSGYYGWAKAIEIYKKGQWDNPAPRKVGCVKCEHSVDKNGAFGLIRYFKPVDLVEDSV